MSSMVCKKTVMNIVIVFVAGFTCMIQGMNKEEKITILDNWSRYITSDKNKKKFHKFYLYEKGSLYFIEQIVEVDKDLEELSNDTLKVIRLLSEKCKARFDASIMTLNVYSKFEGINNLLLNQKITTKKKLQIFNAVILDPKTIGESEYHGWLCQAITLRNSSVIHYLMGDRFMHLLPDDFYHSFFQLIKYCYGASKGEFPGRQIEVFHFFFKTVEDFWNDEIEITQPKNEKKDKQRLRFCEKQKKQLLDFLHSDNGYYCLALAVRERGWDYVDYCLEREEDKIGVSRECDIISFIVNENLSIEEKNILVRHIIARARQQGTLKNVIFPYTCKALFSLAEKKFLSLLRYALYSGIDIHNVDNEKNVFICFLDHLESNNISFNKKKELIEVFLSCLNEYDCYEILNPKKNIAPLSFFRSLDRFDMFKLLVTVGAHPWHANDFLGKDFNITSNACTNILMLNELSIEEGYLDLTTRWQYVKWMVDYAKDKKKLEELLNKKGTFQPLIAAITDTEDREGIIADYLIKNGAGFNAEMFAYLLRYKINSVKEVTHALETICKKVKHNELAPLFDNSIHKYSGEEIWPLVVQIEKANRKDGDACLYSLYSTMSDEAYEYIKEKITSGDSKKIIKRSLKIMKRKEEVLKDNHSLRYSTLERNNVRYSDAGLTKNKSVYERIKYVNDI